MINKPEIDEQRLLNNLFAFRLLSALILVGLAPLVVQAFPYAPEIKAGVVTVSIAYFFLSLNQIFVSIFQKYLCTERIAAADLASRLTLLAGVIIARLADAGLSGMIWAMIASNLVSFGGHYWLARKFTTIGWRFDWVVWREIFSRSWPLMLTIVLNLVYLKADILFLSLLKSDAEVGWYGAAYKVVDVLVTIPFLFAGIMLPIMVRRWHGGERSDFYRVLQKMLDLTALIAVPLLIGGYFLADPIMLYVAGIDFVISGAILQILLLAVVAVFFSCVFTHTMVCIDRTKDLIVYYLLTAATALPVYYYGVKYWSYYGAAWGTVYSEIMMLILAAWLVWRRTGFVLRLKVLFKALLAAGFMALGLAGLQPWAKQGPAELIVTLLVGMIIYGAFLYWFSGFSRADLLALAKKE